MQLCESWIGQDSSLQTSIHYDYVNQEQAIPWLASYEHGCCVLLQCFSILAYRLYTVVPRLIRFVEDLTNWYIRMNRKRLKGETDTDDCKAALETLFIVIYSMVKVMVGVLEVVLSNQYLLLLFHHS